MKFGGTSVADGDCIRQVADILKHYRASGHELAVVVSACSGITDQIIAMAQEAATSREPPPIEAFIESLRQRHRAALETAAPDHAVSATEGRPEGPRAIQPGTGRPLSRRKAGLNSLV